MTFLRNLIKKFYFFIFSLVSQKKILKIIPVMTKVRNKQTPNQDSLSQLVKLFNEGKLVQVLEISKSLIKQYPNSHVLWNIIGAASKGLGKINKAVKAFENVTKVNPTFPDGFNNLGVMFHEQGNFRAAEKACLKAISLKPDYGVAYYNLGNALKDQDKLDRAIEAFKKALSLHPDHAEAYNNLGIALKSQGNLNEALKHFHKALEKKPNFASAYFNIGTILKEQGDLEKAVTNYKKAIKLNPKYAEAYYNLGNTLNEQGLLNLAIKSFQEAVSLKPFFVEAHFNIGNVYVKKNELEKAVHEFNKVISLSPKHLQAQINLGNTLKRLKKFDKAIKTYKKARSLEPKNGMVYYNLANAFREQGKYKEALEYFKKSLYYEPDNLSAKHLIASLTGENTNTAPREYVERLFDDFAVSFEETLIGDLGYNLPKTILEIVQKNYSSESLGIVLDLGCGTGLLGLEIRNYCKRLEGIDLSAAMLKEAEEKNIYDKLHQSEIIEYLASASLDFDYVISLDVFIYIGDLDKVFHLIKSRSKKTVKFVFSTEHTDKDGFHLEETGRYSHSKNYVQNLCRKYDCKLSYFSKTNLRKEKNNIIIGGIYVIEI